MHGDATQNCRNRSDGFPKMSSTHSLSLLCSPATKVLRDSFDSHFPRATLRSNLYFSILSHSLARFYYSVNWFSSAILSFARLKSPMEDKKPEGGSAATRRETGRDEARRAEKTSGRPSLCFSHEFNFQWFLLNCECSCKRERWAAFDCGSRYCWFSNPWECLACRISFIKDITYVVQQWSSIAYVYASFIIANQQSVSQTIRWHSFE